MNRQINGHHHTDAQGDAVYYDDCAYCIAARREQSRPNYLRDLWEFGGPNGLWLSLVALAFLIVGLAR